MLVYILNKSITILRRTYWLWPCASGVARKPGWCQESYKCAITGTSHPKSRFDWRKPEFLKKSSTPRLLHSYSKWSPGTGYRHLDCATKIHWRWSPWTIWRCCFPMPSIYSWFATAEQLSIRSYRVKWVYIKRKKTIKKTFIYLFSPPKHFWIPTMIYKSIVHMYIT